MIHILVVEDDEDLNRSLCRYLTMQGYSAKGVYSGNQGIQALYETNGVNLRNGLAPFSYPIDKHVSSNIIRTACS